MARVINGILEVVSFDPTGNPGEYTFTNAMYTNLADVSGNGAYDLATGFLLAVPAADLNWNQIPGITHRYRITTLNIIDINHIDATVLWDEDGPEIDTPALTPVCIISEATPNRKFLLPVSDTLYTQVAPGADIAALVTDLINITDKLAGGGGTGVQRYVLNFNPTDWVSGSLQVVHNLNSTDVGFQVLENVAGIFEPTSVGVRYLNSSTLELLIEPTAVFTGKVVVTL